MNILEKGMMYKRVILLGLQFLVFGLWATAPDYEVVWEKEFDKPISKVVWAYENDTLYPKVLVIGKTEVRFLNPSGEVEARLTFRPSKVYISPNGKYVGVETFIVPEIPYAYDPHRPPYYIRYLRLYDDKGELLWGVQDTLMDTEEYYAMHISNKGIVIVDRPFYGGLDLFNLYGNRKIIAPFGFDVDWGVRGWSVIWTESGNKFILLGGANPIRGPKSLWLILYDANGNEIWRKPIDARVGKIYSSYNAKYMLLDVWEWQCHDGETHWEEGCLLLDSLGNIIKEMPNVRGKATFSPDEKLFVLCQGNKFSLVKSADGQILWEKKLTFEIMSAKFLTANEFVVISYKRFPREKYEKQLKGLPVSEARKRYSELLEDFCKTMDDVELFAFDISGNIIWHRKYTGRLANRDILQAVAPDRIVLKLGKTYKMFRKIQREED